MPHVNRYLPHPPLIDISIFCHWGLRFVVQFKWRAQTRVTTTLRTYLLFSKPCLGSLESGTPVPGLHAKAYTTNLSFECPNRTLITLIELMGADFELLISVNQRYQRYQRAILLSSGGNKTLRRQIILIGADGSFICVNQRYQRYLRAILLSSGGNS